MNAEDTMLARDIQKREGGYAMDALKDGARRESVRMDGRDYVREGAR